MANKFYEIGKAGGERKTDYSKALAPAMETMYNQMIDSKKKLDAFMLNSPQGVVMDKVPKQFISQVTKFLADGKQKYSQAASVLSSGVSSSSQQYMDAVETMNQIQNSFENNANILAAYNVNVTKQKPRVDDIQIGTTSSETTDFNNYVTGDIFTNAELDYKTGNILYSSSDLTNTEQQKVSEYIAPGETTDRAGETFSAISAGVMSSKRTGDSWELTGIQLEKDYDGVMNKIQNIGRRELVFSDEDYMQTIITADKANDEEGYESELMEIMSDPEKSENAIAGYKEYNMTAYKRIFDLTKTPVDNSGSKSKFYDGFTYDAIGGSAESKSAKRRQIKDRVNFGDFDGSRGYYTYNPNSDDYTVVTPPVYSKDGKTKLQDGYTTDYSVFDMLKREGLLRDGETDPSKIVKASSANSGNTPTTTAKPLFPVEEIVAGLSEKIFNQDAEDAGNELKALFTNIPGFKVKSTERDGVIVEYKGKTIEVMSSSSENLSKEDAESLSRSRENLIKWLETVAIKPAI